MIPGYLTPEQRSVVEHYQALNVVATWYYTAPDPEDGQVNVIVIDVAERWVWEIHIATDGDHCTHEASLPPLEFETGITV